MSTYKIVLTCHDVNPAISPHKEELPTIFTTRTDAECYVRKLVDTEVTMLNQGSADGEFLRSFDREAHDAVVEFWEGIRSDNFEEMSRDMWPVTEYDIAKNELT